MIKQALNTVNQIEFVSFSWVLENQSFPLQEWIKGVLQFLYKLLLEVLPLRHTTLHHLRHYISTGVSMHHMHHI